MSFGTCALRWYARGGVAAIVALAAAAGTPVAATAAQAGKASATAAADTPPVTNPYAPSYHHGYRHGAVPTLAAAARMASWASQHSSAAAASPALSPAAAPAAEPASANNVRYGGAVDGIGVTTGDEKVYLVFFGNQWGTQGTNGKGDFTFSNDPSGEAPYLQEMFKGLGTGGEQWSGLLTQYCQGVAVGAQTCPATARHVAYPHGGALADVWYDNGGPSPAQADGHDLAVEAVAAAEHFGNTSAAANRDAQYVILSPTATDPDQWLESGFCAWHDWNGDSILTGGPASSPDGDIAFTNMPYVTDAGAGCGEHFLRPGGAGVRDGVSIVGGHEYAETVTDQNPPGGWLDSSFEEISDKCAWRMTGLGKVALLSLPTGTFAMQGSWANNANSGTGGCRFSQSIKATELLRNRGFENGTLPPWTATSGVLKQKSSSFPAHSGSWLARLGGRTAPRTDTLSQVVKVAPTDGTYGAATFSFWLRIKTNDPAGATHDTLTVQVLDAGGGTVLKTLHTYSNLSTVGRYVQHSFSLNSFLGQTITLKFTSAETLAGHSTSFFIDDTALNAS